MADLSDLPIRDDLRGMTPYGAPQKQVRYALNVNENTHAVPEAVARPIVESLNNLASSEIVAGQRLAIPAEYASTSADAGK